MQSSMIAAVQTNLVVLEIRILSTLGNRRRCCCVVDVDIG